MPDKRYIYTGNQFPDININPVCYKPDFFQLELDLESDVFYELRKLYDIRPIKINESSPEDLKEIKDFFENNRNTFYFLFYKNNELIGSILHIKNYIQCLSISRKFQRQGYGEKLSKYCINQILKKGFPCVELNVLNGNIKAEKLYTKLGFVEIK